MFLLPVPLIAPKPSYPSLPNMKLFTRDCIVVPSKLLASQDPLALQLASAADTYFGISSPVKACEGLNVNIAELRQLCWNRLHEGSWREVQQDERKLYAAAGMLTATVQWDKREAQSALEQLDLVLMMSGPQLLSRIGPKIELLENYLNESSQSPVLLAEATEHSSRKRKREDAREFMPNVGLQLAAIPRVAAPSLEEFHRVHYSTKLPVIITGAIDFWPALGKGQQNQERSWASTRYLKTVAGRRTVPVEIGDDYMDSQWTQILIPFSKFMDTYISSGASDGPKGYLAQHQLFDQIPNLRRDIAIPDYCSACDEFLGDNNDEVVINAWYGPAGIRSRLHKDPYDNLYAQVVGQKYVCLFPPDQGAAHLYPDAQMANTSQVNVEDPNFDKFPFFRQAKGWDCVLREGELLYIPKGYWHFLKSLTTSFSASFWW